MLSLCTLLWICAAAVNDFELGERAYDNEQYRVAQAYFEAVRAQDPDTEHRADILHYLFDIHVRERDIPHILQTGSQFLSDYARDRRSASVLSALVQELRRKQAHGIIAEYLMMYDYLVTDQSVYEMTAGELIARKQFALAESLLQCCTQTDTVTIMRASLTENRAEREALYSALPGVQGRLYRAEFYLEQGDTIDAFEVFRSMEENDIEEPLLFRYARVSRLFDKGILIRTVDRLERMDAGGNKARLLRALETGQLGVLETPLDAAEASLLARYVGRDTVSRKPPEQINIDSVLADSSVLTRISRLRRGIKNYFLDSLYVDVLLREGRVHDAHVAIKPYFAYQNTVRFARMVHALYRYQNGEYERAARDIILSRTRALEWLYLLARAFTLSGRESDYLYRDVVEMSSDSALVHRARRELMEIDFAHGAYDNVLGYGLETAQEDTQLIELYAYSLARTGNYGAALSIFKQYFDNETHELKNYYGEYLIEHGKYGRARTLYDSMMTAGEAHVPSIVYYNWALIPFLQGNVDTAMMRFEHFRDVAPNSDEMHQVFFKMATLYYAQQAFDSAAYYYGLAREDSSLTLDALQNQLVCFKKASRWDDAIAVGTLLRASVPEEKKHAIIFDLGYASLRSGQIRPAIDYLKTAVTRKSTPEYHYWLAEAYLGKGDFVRALYHYRKIVDAFPKDEMWTPTAQYKTGLVLEFLDEPDEARAVYEQITKQRGRSDTWSIEAQKRLDELSK